MSTPITFQVYGTPCGQPRPRGRAFVPRGGGKPRAMMYDPKTSDAWKFLVARAATPHAPAVPFAGPVSVKLAFSFARPASHFRSGRFAGELKPRAPRFVESKPDNDNLEKAVFDCLTQTGLFWKDDAQIAHNETLKIYGATGGVMVEIKALGLAHGSPFWVFELNDCDWYVARSLEEAKSHYLLNICDDEENVRHARALTDEEMDTLKFWNSESRDPMDFEHWRCDCGAKADGTCRWNGTAYEHPHEYPVGHILMKNVDRMTFRERLAQLVADGLSKPEFFATTEW